MLAPVDDHLPIFHKLLAFDPHWHLLERRGKLQIPVEEVRLRIENQRLLWLVPPFVSELVYEAPINSSRYNLGLVIDRVDEVDHPRPQRKVAGIVQTLIENVHFEIGRHDQVDEILLRIRQAVDAIAASHVEELGGEQGFALNFHVCVLFWGPDAYLLLRVRHEAFDRWIVLAVLHLQAIYVLVVYVQILETEFHLHRHLPPLQLRRLVCAFRSYDFLESLRGFRQSFGVGGLVGANGPYELDR